MSDVAIRPALFVPAGRLDFSDDTLSPLDVFCSPVTDPFIAMMTETDDAYGPTRVMVCGRITNEQDPTFEQKIRYDRRINLTDARPEAPYAVATATVGDSRMRSVTFVTPGQYPSSALSMRGPGQHNQLGQTDRAIGADGYRTVTCFGGYDIDMNTQFDTQTGGLCYLGSIRNNDTGHVVTYNLSTVKVPGSTATDSSNAISGRIGDLEIVGTTRVAGNKIEVNRTIGPYHVHEIIRQEYR